jgi:hypothetical protein
MKSRKIYAICIGVFALISVAVAEDNVPKEQPAAEKSAKDPLAAIQGSWQMMQKGPDGAVYKIVKTVVAKKESVFYYKGDEVVRAHTVDLEIKRSEQFTIFTFRNLTVTAGAAKGTVLKGPFFSVCQTKGGKWCIVHGLINDDDTPFSVEVFEKVEARSD